MNAKSVMICSTTGSLFLHYICRYQTGTIRSNCLDCLDRTNSVQSLVGLQVWVCVFCLQTILLKLICCNIVCILIIVYWILLNYYFYVYFFFTVYNYIVIPPFEEDILLCTYRSVGLSVCPSVTFSFPINNSRTPWPTVLKLCPHIGPGQQRNPIDFAVTGSKVTGSNMSKLFQVV